MRPSEDEGSQFAIRLSQPVAIGHPNHQIMSVVLQVAEQFAESLDAEDYQAAEAMLSEECEYTCRGQVYRGRAAIIESYRGTGDCAKRGFNNVEYESAVRSIADNVALIHFIDHLCHNDRHFTFECQQLIKVGGDCLITRIEHVDLAGQREALTEFMQQVGVSRRNQVDG
jgi:hypothetical protein